MYQIEKALANLRKIKKKSTIISIEDKGVIDSTIDLLKKVEQKLYKAELKAEAIAERYCFWLQQDGEYSEDWLACDGKLFCLTNGTPSENGMLFCPYCGKNLVEVTYAEQFLNEDGEEEGANEYDY